MTDTPVPDTDRTPQRFTGFVPELSRDPFGHGELPIPGASPLPARLMQPHLGEILDQGEIASCASNSFAGALAHRARMQGNVDAALPSRALLYRQARCIQVGKTAGLPIGGVRFSECAVALEHYGFCDEKWDPYEPAEIAKNPDRDSLMQAYMYAHDQRGKAKMHPVDPSKIREHLIAGHALVTGFEIDGSFHAASMAEPWRLSDRTGDYHAVRIVGYDVDGVVILNSWGLGWGENGLAKVTYDTIESGLGVWAVEWVPSFSENNPLAGAAS
jgi:hypothetical protein